MNTKEARITYTQKNIESLAVTLASFMGTYTLLTFTGALGAGKTTLIRAILANLGVKEPVTSPTFTYVQLYHTADGKKVYHFDLYRIDEVEQFFATGFDEYINDEDALVVIEWPEIILPYIRRPACHITIEHDTEKSRTLGYVCDLNDFK